MKDPIELTPRTGITNQVCTSNSLKGRDGKETSPQKAPNEI